VAAAAAGGDDAVTAGRRLPDARRRDALERRLRHAD